MCSSPNLTQSILGVIVTAKIQKFAISSVRELLLFLEPIYRHFEGDDVRILRDGDVAEVGEGVVNGDDVLDAHPYPEVDLQRGFLLAIKVGLLLEVADARTQGHNLLVAEFHAEMRVHAQHIYRFCFYKK